MTCPDCGSLDTTTGRWYTTLAKGSEFLHYDNLGPGDRAPAVCRACGATFIAVIPALSSEDDGILAIAG